MDEDKTETKLRESPFCGSRRLLVAMVGFVGSIHLYSMRMTLSVGILCMTNHTAVALMQSVSLINTVANDSSLLSCENAMETVYKDGGIDWDKSTRGFILGVFFWGYLVSQIPAGLMVARGVSVKWMLLGAMLLASVSVLLLPAAAVSYHGIVLVAILRVICGIASGVWFPCMHQLWSRWAPPKERSKLVGLTYSGLHCGNALTLPIAGILCEHGFAGGWPSIFYLSGMFGVFWCLLWVLLVNDSPATAKHISKREKFYIESSLVGQIVTDKSKMPTFTQLPWMKIFTSKPFWAIALINIAFDWNGYTFVTSTPTYMKDVLKFNMAQNGFASAAPYVGMGISQVLFALLCHHIQNRGTMSITWIRKLMTIIGMLIPALVLVILSFLTCHHRYVAVVLLTIGLSSTSAMFVGPLVNHVDIAPQYAGLLLGLTNTLGAFTGFFSSYFVQAITSNNTIEQWRIVFFVGAFIYVLGAVVYVVFGSGRLQEWAVAKIENIEIKTQDEDSSKEEMQKFRYGEPEKTEKV